MLRNKNIVLGVSGGIAAYKAAELTSRLKKLGANVFVIMTKSACEFISPLTMGTLSQNRVATGMFSVPEDYDVHHISLAERADVLAIVPATANIIGKIANGIADDMLSTVVMATKAPKVIAPAMNTAMFENEIVQENIKKLEKMGYEFVEPATKRLACGSIGKGALADLDIIEDAICKAVFSKKDLTGKKILVTAGPTREEIDPVRFITNHSSGKMGCNIAKFARYRGAEVTLIAGPMSTPLPFGVKLINVTSALDMYKAVTEEFEKADIIIKSAAVADFRPVNKSDNKIKKADGMPVIELCENPDILAEVGKIKGERKVIAFCMETQNLLENAKKKLEAKNADMIVANSLCDEGAGFGCDTNTVTFLYRDGKEEKLPNMPKEQVANEILDRIELL